MRLANQPRLGNLRLKERGYLPTSGVHILSATVCEEAGRWFVSIRVEEEVPDPVPASGDPIGIDLGIKTLAQCSDGIAIENPKALRSELKRLKRLHRRLSRRKKGGKNRDKARIRLTRMYARIAHIRRDALHKGTRRLTRARLSQEARADRLNQIASALPEPKAKVKLRKGRRSPTMGSPPLAEKVARQVKRKQVKHLLRQTTEMDAPMRPRNVVLEDLSERIYMCEHCGLVMDRDQNASLNLAALIT